MDLGYPGGPKIDKVSKEGDPQCDSYFQGPELQIAEYDFSFSGLKSAVLNYINWLKNERRGNLSS